MIWRPRFSSSLAKIQEVSLPSTATGQLFARATRKQLLDCAKRLGLQGVSALTKEELAGRVHVAFEGIRPVAAPTNGGGSATHKFDLGPTRETEAMPQDIPWGYGQDRVTAMVIDPDRLYVYWEVTDDAITAARAGLGPAGANAWLNVRVYDITGRLFDGTNAHSYFDHRIERHDRQWFFVINKPTSTACVEVGLMSPEGYFVKTSRSGRVEFPRREVVGEGPIEWLSVRTASGWAGSPFTGSPPGPGGGAPAGAPGGGARGGGGGGGEAPPAGWEDWTPQAGFPVPGGQRVLGRRWEVQEGGVTWTSELNKSEWSGPLLRTEWEAGPFVYPMEVPAAVEFRDSGEIAIRNEGGRVHISYGPWQVVIRGLGARAERRVLGTWEYRRQIALTGGVERVGTETRSGAGQLRVAALRRQRTDVARRQRASVPRRQRAVPDRRQRDPAGRRQRDVVPGGQRAAVPRRQRTPAPRRQRTPGARRQRVGLRRRQRTDVSRRQRTRLRRGQRTDAGRRQRTPGPVRRVVLPYSPYPAPEPEKK